MEKVETKPERRKYTKEKSKRQIKTGYTKGWQQSNPSKIKVYNKNHRNHDITEQEWQACQKAFNYCCAYCNKTLKEQKEQNKEQFHKDHVDHEGYNDIRNCVPACTQCNTIKHKKSIEFLLEQNIIEGFTQKRYNNILLWITEGYKKYIEDKPPYRILRKKDSNNRTYHHELWTVDEKRNIIECIHTNKKKNDIVKWILQNPLN
jgi:hypothetical protein